MKDIWLRPAKPEDAAAVAELHKMFFSHGATEDMLIHQISREGDYVVVAEKPGRIVGTADFSSVLDEGSIGNIAVHKDFHRQGIGKALLDELISEAQRRGLAFLTLEVRRGNEAAVSLYKSAGFQEVGIRKSYYSCPTEDALLLTLYF